MASLQDIKKRIDSVKNTQKITRAMKLVSAAKLRKSTEKAHGAKPYEQELRGIVSSVLHGVDWNSPLVEERTANKVAFVIVSPDKGLCGGLNSNLMKLAWKRAEALKGSSEVKIFAIGKKGRDYFKKRDYEIAFEHLDLIRHGTHEEIYPIAKQLRELFLNKEYDRVEVFYTSFQSALVQRATHTTLLPFKTEECAEDPKPFLYKPTQKELLDSLVPMLIDFRVYQYVLESVASEHGARMAAMEAATNNARDMIERLTLQRNRARQAAITTELMEIISGAEALAS